jgi:molybdopterin/thiamine biosynthesis adenylyltransferase
MSKGRRRVMIIGAGGIGSYLIPLLDKTMVYNMTVMDPDNVEKKNLTYQNFKEKENGMNKASVMNWNYDSVKQFSPYPVLTEKQIKSFDLVVCCADNLDVRRLLYRSNVPWLDLRAQGRNCAYISYRADKNKHDTLLAGPDGSFSCQGNSWDGSTEGQHFSHIIAAGMGAEWIHRYFAKDDVADFKVVNV